MIILKINQRIVRLIRCLFIQKDKLENFKFKVKVSNLDVYVIRFYFI